MPKEKKRTFLAKVRFLSAHIGKKVYLCSVIWRCKIAKWRCKSYKNGGVK